MHTTKLITLGERKEPVAAQRLDEERSLLKVASTLRKAGLEQNAVAIERAMDHSNPGWRARVGR